MLRAMLRPVFRICTALGVAFAALQACASPPEAPAKLQPAHEADEPAAPPVAVRSSRCPCRIRQPAAHAPALQLSHGPLLGAVTDRSIKVWARGEGEAELIVRYAPADAPELERCSRPVPLEHDRDHIGVAQLAALQAATTYRYSLETKRAGEPCATTITEPMSFRTLPARGQPARVRFVVAADVSGADVPGFADIEAVAPDFVLLIGDNVYADLYGWVPGDLAGSFGLARKAYQETWGSPQFRALFSRVPAFMMWDDHEITENYWSGKNDLRYEVGRTLFDLYQGSHNPDPIHAGELYYSFRAGDIGFFVLDLRTHRDGNMAANDAGKSMLGAAQHQAFEEWLASDDSRVHVIVSSVIVSDFRTTGADPWRAFSAERDALLAVLAEHKTANTFIVSGDQHWSAVLKLSPGGELEPYSLYEFQATPLASGERPVPAEPDERVLALDNKHLVFGVFDVDTRTDPPLLDFTMCAVGGPCAPHREPPPSTVARDQATLPYSLFFSGSDRGFVLRAEHAP
jgi:alkaline phosphatase D